MKQLRVIASVTILTFSLLLSSVFSIGLFAQNNESITLGISPQILDITANPGETSVNTFRLTNGSKDSVDVIATPKNFTPLGEEGSVNITEEKTTYSLADWTKVSPNKARLDAGKTTDFKVTIEIPNDAEPGSHFGSVVFRTIPPDQTESTTSFSQEIAPVILVKVAGDITETAEIIEFKPEMSSYSSSAPVKLISRIKNTGSSHFKPKGKIVIQDTFGKEVTRLTLDEKNILPDSIRQITSDWTGSAKMGKYSAILTIVYGEGQTQTSSTSFIIYPSKGTIITVLGIITLLVLVVIFRKRIILALKVLSGKESSK